MSTVLHALAACLLLIPAVASGVLHVDTQSRGLLAVLRGGGRGSGAQERLQWFEQSVPRAQPNPPRVIPPRPAPRPAPVIQPTVPRAAPPPPVPPAPTDSASSGSLAPGTRDGDATGTGSAQGRGVGTGTGPGAGNGGGPGTSGTPTASKFKAVPTEILPPSLGDPPKDRPFRLVATFEVSERGESRLLSMTQSKDGGFNRRVRDDLETFRFHPATLPNGVPVKDTVQVEFDY